MGEEFEQYGVDGADKVIMLFSFGAPVPTHELCLDDYVSPTLQKLRDMGVGVTFHGIGLGTAVMDNLKCIADDVADFVDEENQLTNTESATALAKEWGYYECAYGEQEEPESVASAQAVVINEDPQMEIIFLLDTSSDVSLLNFMDQMTFVDTMTDCFATYMEPRMSVMSYGDEVMKLQGLDDDPNWSHDDPSVGGDRNTDGALAMALEEFEQYGVDGADKLILLFSFGAPMANHEPCLDDYVSPTLQKLRDMGVVVTTHGINLSSEVMNNLKCMVSASDDLDEEDQEDHLTNTESATALADQWGYTACAYGEEEENE